MTTPEPTLNTVLPVYRITSGYYAGMSGILQRYSVGIRCICKYVQYQVPVIILEFLSALTIHSTHWTHIQCWYRFSVGNSCLSKVTQLWFSRR